MSKIVDVYWSHQSPYCYFALDRLLALNTRPDVEVTLRLVLPGLLRNPGRFKDASVLEEDYFFRDVQRTADFLNLPYAEASPYPVEMQPGTVFRAEPEQSRVHHLYHLTAAADELGRGWEFIDRVTRLIWDGTTRDWHVGHLLADAVASAGLDHDELLAMAAGNCDRYQRVFAANHEELMAAGHWGVPTFVFDREPFFGQDRFRQLLWRMNIYLPSTSQEQRAR